MILDKSAKKNSGRGFEFIGRVDRARTQFIRKYTSRGSRGTILGRIGRVDLEFEDFEVGVPDFPYQNNRDLWSAVDHSSLLFL